MGLSVNVTLASVSKSASGLDVLVKVLVSPLKQK